MQSEVTPLLSAQHARTQVDHHESNTTKVETLYNHVKQWKAVYLCSLFILFYDFPSFMRVAPKLRMYELALCRDYYREVDPSVIDRNGAVDEKLCKLSIIQSDLAYLRGIIGFLEAIPGKLYPWSLVT
jgi:hypothetical protein